MKNDQQDPDQESLLEFPCEFQIKVMGLAEDSFDQLVVEMIEKHVDDLPATSVKIQESSHGKYCSVTVTITAESKSQLDTIYRELSEHDRVMMAL